MFRQEHVALIVRWSRLLFTPIAIMAVIWFLFSNFYNVLEIAKTAKPEYLILSSALWCSVNVSVPLVTYKLFSANRQKISLSDVVCIHLRRLPAKYIPGGVWHMAARGVDYIEAGFSRRELLNVLAAEHVMAIMITAGMGGTGVYFYTSTDYWSYIGLVAGLLVLVGLVSVLFILYRRGSGSIQRDYIEAFLTHFVVWLFASISFLAYYNAFEFNSVDNSPVYIMFSYMFAWSLGFVSFFTPQGFGVFEAVIADLLTSSISIASVAFIFVGFRFVILASDLATYLTYLLIKR